jgi:hypothetical protein
MKKRIIYTISFIAIAILAGINIQVNENEKKIITINFNSLTASAGYEMNPVGMWPSQGMYQDEKSETRVCPSSSSFSMEACLKYQPYEVCLKASQSQSNPPNRYEYICPHGYSNCTPVGC